MNSESNGIGRSTAVIWLAALALFAIINVGRLTLSSVGHDFYQFWSIGQTGVLNESSHLYAASNARAAAQQALRQVSGPNGSQRGQRAAAINRQLYPAGADPISTPTYYWAFSALSGGDFDVDLLFFQFLSITSLLVAGWLLCRSLGYTPIETSLALTVVMLAFGPLHADIEAGNTNRMQLTLLAAAGALHHRGSSAVSRSLAGAVLGFLIVLKPNLASVPLLLGATWWIDRRFAELRDAAIGWLLGAGVAIAIGSLAFSWDSWGHWISALSVYQSVPAPISQSNWSLARLVYEWTGSDFSAVLAAALLVGAAGCAWWGRTSETTRAPLHRDIATIAAALLVPLLASQIAWDHYFLMAVPALIFSLRPRRGNLAQQICAGAALLACAVTPLRVAWPAIGPTGLAISVSAATAVLFALVMWELARRSSIPNQSDRA